ncbi:MAG: cyclase family protein [Anaerovoracaceae bacterium]|jgi:kynurenine formamidase
MKKYIDLCHRMFNGMETYPDYPGITIDTYLGRKETGERFGEKAAAQIDRINMLNCSGTYLDAPYHVREEGYKVADIPLSKLVDLDYDIVELKPGKNCFDVEDLEGKCIRGGAMLLCTGDYEKFGTPEYGTDNPPWSS